MKHTGDFDRSFAIQQHKGGYVVVCADIGVNTEVFLSFEQVVNHVARNFGLVEVGEQLLVLSTKDKK